MAIANKTLRMVSLEKMVGKSSKSDELLLVPYHIDVPKSRVLNFMLLVSYRRDSRCHTLNLVLLPVTSIPALPSYWESLCNGRLVTGQRRRG
jgi:hypothetical protein